MTRYGFVPPTSGTCERGSAERGRQETMIEAAGGVLAYMLGAKPSNRVDGDMLECYNTTSRGTPAAAKK